MILKNVFYIKTKIISILKEHESRVSSSKSIKEDRNKQDNVRESWCLLLSYNVNSLNPAIKRRRLDKIRPSYLLPTRHKPHQRHTQIKRMEKHIAESKDSGSSQTVSFDTKEKTIQRRS